MNWEGRRDNAALLILDPRVPGQRPDSALGSVLGRPDPNGRLTQHFAQVRAQRDVLPEVAATVELFRSTQADRGWLAQAARALLARPPARAGTMPYTLRAMQDATLAVYDEFDDDN